MKIVRSVAELRRALTGHEDVGLVPTMGFLHEGHLSLIRRARAECDTVVVSLFVNPKQFGPGEDLDAYPRDEARDATLAEACGADLLFAPSHDEVYPDGFATTVEVAGLTDVLCGAARPGHFAGVTTVVAKLFNMVGPDVAYFGQKDAQQALVIRKLVRDLDMPVRVEICPTVREPDGLALSSRNAYLSADERQRALGLSRALRAAEAAVAEGRVAADDGPRGSPRTASPGRGRARVPRAQVGEGPQTGRACEWLDAVGSCGAGGPRTFDRQHHPHGGPMRRKMLKSKIHRATVTGSDLHYVGSITVDADLLEAADILEHELVHVLDVDNGARFETYTIAGQRGSGEIKINGAAARLVHTGDTVIVVSYADYEREELETYEPVVVHVDKDNRIVTVDDAVAELLA